MDIIRFFLNLTPHELDVVRTIAIVIGTGSVPLLSFLLGWAVKILRAVKRDAEAANHNTRRTERIGGTLHTVSIAEDVKRTMHNTEELAHLVGDVPRIEPRPHGRRRNTPTNQIPTEGSHYE